MKSRDKVLKTIQKQGQISVQGLTEMLGFSRQYVHRILIELEEAQLIKKLGQAPRVYYSSISEVDTGDNTAISFDQELFLEQHFILVDAMGEKLQGLAAMKYWCERQNLPLDKTVNEFVITRQKYLNYQNEQGLISGLEKVINSKGIGSIGIDELYYLDFYAIERFGKTRLGTLMHYAKQGQNKSLMKIIVSEIRHRINFMIQQQGIDAILYVPPTIGRKVQIMEYLEKHLDLQLPKLKIEKIKTTIIVPQKALSKIFERVANAKNTFVIPIQNSYNHVLIIDDAVGSGATINEIALKIKDKKLTNKITGLAITGIYKGFEVISEL